MSRGAHPRRTGTRSRDERARVPVPFGTHNRTASRVHSIERRLGATDHTGAIARCWPSLDDIRAGDGVSDHDGRAVYPSADAAEAAAAELADATRRPCQPVECHRVSSDHGQHWHTLGR